MLSTRSRTTDPFRLPTCLGPPVHRSRPGVVCRASGQLVAEASPRHGARGAAPRNGHEGAALRAAAARGDDRAAHRPADGPDPHGGGASGASPWHRPSTIPPTGGLTVTDWVGPDPPGMVPQGKHWGGCLCLTDSVTFRSACQGGVVTGWPEMRLTDWVFKSGSEKKEVCPRLPLPTRSPIR